MSEKEKLCECGCGEYTKPGNRFIHGHNNQGKDNPMYNKKGENSPYYKERILIICKYCKKEFYVQPNERNRKFCSLECFGKYQSENLNSENNPHCKEKIMLICKYCKKEFYVLPYLNYRKFCSNECYNKWSIGVNNSRYGTTHTDETLRKMSATSQGISYDDWKSFAVDQKYCRLFSNKFKEKIREIYHRKCFICSKSEKDNNQKLSVHHVNYDKNCLCGFRCEFVPLCSYCHGKTNGKRKYWEDLIMCYLYPERYFMIDI